MESVVENISREPEKPVDRSKVCPVLVRVFVGNGRHNSITDYSRGKTPSHELQLYTWLDATLKELTSLIRVTGDEGRRKGSKFEFSVVYADTRSQAFRMRDIGSTTAGIPGSDDNVTLGSKKFQLGDYLDVSVTNPRRFNNHPYRNNRPRQFHQ